MHGYAFFHEIMIHFVGNHKDSQQEAEQIICSVFPSSKEISFYQRKYVI